jgi:hypothetical protein
MGWLAMNIFDRSAVSQVRLARPTDRLDEIETFYQEAIGLPTITSWRDGIDGNHAGYDGLILGMPDGRYHVLRPVATICSCSISWMSPAWIASSPA